MNEGGVVFRKGRRVILRPLNKATDLQPLVRGMNDPEVTQYLLRYRPITAEEEEAWFDELRTKHDDIVLAIEPAAGDRKFIRRRYRRKSVPGQRVWE